MYCNKCGTQNTEGTKIGFIVTAMTEKRQRVGDRLAGTVVVRKR